MSSGTRNPASAQASTTSRALPSMAAKIAVGAIRDYLAAHEEIEEARMVCFDERTRQAYEAAARE